MRLPIQISTIVFRKNRSKIEYLILHRIKSRGDFWQFVSGGLEEGETRKECVFRELVEETGIKKVKRFIDSFHYQQFNDKYLQYRKYWMTEYVYAVEVSQNTEINIKNNVYPEHNEYRWVSIAEAVKHLKYKDNKNAYLKLDKLLH